MEWQRRSHPRIPVHYPVRLLSDDHKGAGILLNLSPSGCQIRSALPLETGSYVAVHINVPHQTWPVAVELSIVRWEQNGRYGVEFLRYGHGERERLIRLTSTMAASGVEARGEIQAAHTSPTVEAPLVLATVAE